MKPSIKLTTIRSNYDNKYSNKGNRMYALTVHDNTARWPSPLEYERFLHELTKLGFKTIQYIYEVGELKAKNRQSGKLHLHGVVLGPNPLPYMKHAFTLRGYSYTLKPIYKEQGWAEYQQYNADAFECYMIAHFWDMDTMEYEIDNISRKFPTYIKTS